MSRPDLDKSGFATNDTFSAGVNVGLANKIRPPTNTLADGYSAENPQPTMGEVNYLFNRAAIALDYLDGIEALNVNSFGSISNWAPYVMGWDPIHRIYWGIGSGVWTGGGDPNITIRRSHDGGKTWVEVAARAAIVSAAGGVLPFWTGQAAFASDGSWLALALDNSGGNRSAFVSYDSSQGINAASLVGGHLGLGNFRFGTVKYAPLAFGGTGCFVVGGYDTGSGNTVVLTYKIPGASPPIPDLGSVTITTPRNTSNPVNLIAIGDTYALFADTTGRVWRAPANLSTAAAPLNSGNPLIANAVALHWIAPAKLFWATFSSGGNLTFKVSADGSIWTVPTGGSATLTLALPNVGADFGMDLGFTAVQGTCIHMALKQTFVAVSDVFYVRTFSLDMGATWHPYISLPLDPGDHTIPRFPRLQKYGTEDRVLYLMSADTNQGAAAPTADYAAGLRLGG